MDSETSDADRRRLPGSSQVPQKEAGAKGSDRSLRGARSLHPHCECRADHRAGGPSFGRCESRCFGEAKGPAFLEYSVEEHRFWRRRWPQEQKKASKRGRRRGDSDARVFAVNRTDPGDAAFVLECLGVESPRLPVEATRTTSRSVV
jgi:hypothetical protein